MESPDSSALRQKVTRYSRSLTLRFRRAILSVVRRLKASRGQPAESPARTHTPTRGPRAHHVAWMSAASLGLLGIALLLYLQISHLAGGGGPPPPNEDPQHATQLEETPTAMRGEQDNSRRHEPDNERHHERVNERDAERNAEPENKQGSVDRSDETALPEISMAEHSPPLPRSQQPQPLKLTAALPMAEVPNEIPADVAFEIEIQSSSLSGKPQDENPPIDADLFHVSSLDSTDGDENQLMIVTDNWRSSVVPNVPRIIEPILHRALSDDWMLEQHVPRLDESLKLPPDATGPKELKVAIDKRAVSSSAMSPAEVHRPMSYEIVIRNEGKNAINRTIVAEQIPEPLRVIEAAPPATFDNRTVRWQLLDLKPSEQRVFRITLAPHAAGIAHTTTTFEPLIAVTTPVRIVVPNIQLGVVAPAKVSAGQTCIIRYKITNSSNENVEGITLRIDLPDELSHPKGRQLDLSVDLLAPGTTREARLVTRAEKIGAAFTRAEIVVVNHTVHEVETNTEIFETITTSPLHRAAGRVPVCRCIEVPAGNW